MHTLTEPRIAGIILAAGASTRFGSPKQGARVGERTMLEGVVQVALASGLDPVLAVVPPALAVPTEAVAVPNPEPERGLSHSLQLGIHAVPSDAIAAVVLLGDQPTVTPGTIRRLVAARDPVRHIVATRSGDALGPPVLVDREALSIVDDLAGDVGLRDWLAANPQRVGVVQVGPRPVDVDTPADLERLGERCPGCGVWLAPRADATAHPYLGASVACWAAFGELIAREFSEPTYGVVHRHTVDAYAAQHPGVDGRRQRQSVAVHLIALCHWLEHDLGPDELTRITRRLTAQPQGWPWLKPPTAYGFAAIDALNARSGDEHAELVRRWAEAVWEAWSAHHATVRGWARGALR